MKKTALYLAITVMVAMVLCPMASQAVTWKFYKTVPTPESSWSVIRLAADSSGKVYISQGQSIYYTADILTVSASNEYSLLFTDSAMANGLQGIAFDSADNVYVSGDQTADGNGSLRKFDSAGSEIWRVTPSLRAMGAGILSNGTLITCKFDGRILAYDTATGAEIAEATTQAGNFVRDIAVIPDAVGGADKIYGVRSGSLVKFNGGTASNIIGYSTTELISAKGDTSWQVRPSVTYSSIDNTLIWTNMIDNKVYIMDADTETEIQELTNRDGSVAFDQPGGVVVIDGGDGYQYLIVSSFWGYFSVYRSAQSYDVGKINTTLTIDGIKVPGEWGETTAYCSGFTANGDPTTPAAEDLEVTMLYDDTYMYFAFQQVNSNFALDFVPSGSGRDPSGTSYTGDDYELFIYPGGTTATVGYQIVFFPYSGDGVCYVADYGGTLSAYPAMTSWDGSGDQAAFSYDSGSNLLTIEYRIPFTAFNVAGAVVTGAPADGTVWGLQIGHLNNDGEYPNWALAPVGGFSNVSNMPWGALTFSGDPVSSVADWSQY